MLNAGLFFVGIFLWFFVFPHAIFAQVKITELYPQPVSGEYEWIEIYNHSTQSAILENWVLEDQLSTPKKIFSFVNITLAPFDFFIATISGQLNNGADGVLLKNQMGEVIDSLVYESSHQGLSWSKTLDEQIVEGQPNPNLLFQLLASPIPSPSPMPSPSPTASVSTMFYLHQISPCPAEGKEWLEWQNLSDQRLELSVVLQDEQGNSLLVPIQVEARATSRTTLAKNILNNSGDILQIYYEQQLLETKNLPACDDLGQAFSYLPSQLWPIDSQIDFEVAGLAHEARLESNGQTLEKISQKEDVDFDYPPAVLGMFAFDKQSSSPSSLLKQGLISTEKREFSKPVMPKSISLFLLVGGGFLWSGLGIIGLYGEQIMEH